MPVRTLEFTDLNQQFYDLLAETNEYEFTIDLSDKQSEDAWSKYMKEPNLQVFVYNDKQYGIVGMSSIVIIPQVFFYGVPYATIRQVGVNKKFRNTKIGRSLVDSCCKFAINMKCSKVLCTCGTKNVEFYEKCGFIKSSYSMEKVL